MEEDRWRVCIREIIDMKNRIISTPAGWDITQLEDILNYACVS
jgi:hypothetical protein